MFATTSSRLSAMTAEDREFVGIYATAWLILSIAAFAV